MTYDVILADPPWDFRVWNKDTGSGRSPSAHYKTMNLDDICNLPISKIANKNCALFIWGVWPRIFDCKTVIDAWGFRYATKAWTWIKTDKLNMKPVMGMGYYTRANDEPCLLAVKGNMPVAVHNELALIFSPRKRHSQKPVEQYLKINALYPNTKRLELFAREQHHGWDVFGNEVKESINIFKEGAMA